MHKTKSWVRVVIPEDVTYLTSNGFDCYIFTDVNKEIAVVDDMVVVAVDVVVVVVVVLLLLLLLQLMLLLLNLKVNAY